jgi:DNA-binding YbaB/EbfC family protein
MPDFQQLIQRAQQMQQKMAELQQELAGRTVEGRSGGGLVTAVVNGRQELVSLQIAPQALVGKDVELLEDLIVAAVQDAQKKAAVVAQEAMGALAGGMKLPGLF